MSLLTSVMCFFPSDFSCHHVILVRKSFPTRLRFYWCSGFWMVIPWVIFLVKVVHEPDLETLAGFCKDRELQEGGKWRTTSITFWMLDPISDLRWICKEVTDAGFGYLFPRLSRHFIASNPVDTMDFGFDRVWSLLVKGFSPEGSRKKIHYGNTRPVGRRQYGSDE